MLQLDTVLILAINFNMKKVVIIILALLFSNLILGQDIILSEKLSKKSQNAILIKQSPDSNYLILRNKRKLDLILVNDSLEVLNQTNIIAKYKKQDLRIVSITSIGNRNLVFASFWNYKHKKDYLFARYLNSNGEFIGNWIQLDECYQFLHPEDVSFFLKVSKNQKYFAIYSKNYKEFDRGPIYVNVKVYNNSLELVSSFKSFIGAVNSQVFVEQMEIANNGNVYLKVVENRGTIRTGANYVYRKDFIVLNATSQDSSFSVHKLQLPNKQFITDAVIKVKDDNSLIIGGYYSESGFVSTAGTYCMQLHDNVMENMGTQYFSKALVDRYKLPENYSSKIKNESLKFTAHRLEYNQQGDVFLIGELIVKYTASSKGVGKGSMYDNDGPEAFLYSDILVKKLSGNNNWEQIIAKKQKGNNSPLLSFSYSFNETGFGFVFNTFINDSKNFNAVYKPSSRGRTKLVQIDFQGKVTDERDYKFTSVCNPLVYKPLPFYNKMILLTEKNKLVYFEL